MNTPGHQQQWLKDRIEAIKRAARQEPCPKCGKPTWYGLDGDVMASDARADVKPLDPVEEFTAAINGRATYGLWPCANGRELVHRDDFSIGSPLRHHVLAEHVCPTSRSAAA